MPTTDTAEIGSALGSVPLFASFSKRQLGALAKAARVVAHDAGAEVAAQGRGGLAFHVIASGDATVLVGGVPRRVLRAGDFFGEISLIDGQPRSAAVIAGDGGMTTYVVDRTRFLALVDDDKQFARAVMVALCGRIRASESTS